MTINNTSSHAILFVDDEEKARKMFNRLVSPQFTVLTAEDVIEAKEILKKNHSKIGVLITDQRMPGELGVDLLRYIRKEHPKIIRMLTTAYTDLDDAIEAVNTGEIFRYINKPWNIDELLIDLRLAMNFFEIEQDRLQLINEKMSVSHRQSRMEQLKNLISMSSGQNDFDCPMKAARSFLLQTVDATKLIENTINIDAGGYWESEISKTQSMIKINKSLNLWLQQSLSFITHKAGEVDYQSSVDTASEALTVKAQLTTAGDVSQSVLNQHGITSILKVAMQTLSTDELSITLNNNDSKLYINCSAIVPNDRYINQQVTAGDEKTGELLAMFILANHLGGQVKLDFKEAKLVKIEIILPQAIEKRCDDISDGIWIEDLFVLYN